MSISAGYCYPYAFDLNVTSVEESLLPFDKIEYRASASEEFWYGYILRIAYSNGTLDESVSSWSHWGGMR